jgi:hypothetical protein
VSFFDDEPDEPTRVTRPARPRRARSGASSTRAPDASVVRRRQALFAGGLAVVVILLILLVNSCASTRSKNALKDYNRDVTSIVQSSDDQVSKQLFDVLANGGDAQDVQVAVNQVRLVADDDVKRARALSPPGAMKSAQRYLELTLNFRATGVRRIADLLPRAMSSAPNAADAVRRVAGQMQAFLASDVIYAQRVKPLIAQALSDKGITGQPSTDSRFLPNLGWLDPDQVANRINPEASSSSSTGTGTPKPGTHGHGLVSVGVAGTALQPGTIVNHIPARAPLAIDVTIANQGQNDETNVKVKATISGAGAAISQTKRLNQTTAGKSATVAVTLSRVPAKNSSAKLTVTVEPVNGEKKTDNNTQTYTILFT